MVSSSYLATIFSLSILSSGILAQNFEDSAGLVDRSFQDGHIIELNARSFEDELFELDNFLAARAPPSTGSAKKAPPPVPAKPAKLQAPKTEAGKAQEAAKAKPAQIQAPKPEASKAAEATKAKQPDTQAASAKQPSKLPTTNRVVPDEKKWYQKVGDKMKAPFKSKDQKNFDTRYRDPHPNSMTNLKKMINKEAEVMTGTTATQANLEKWAKPRYEAKLDRIKPQGDVASAELNIHNNKWKGAKDTLQMTSQGVGILKAGGLIRRGDTFKDDDMMLLARSLVIRDMIDEDIWS